MISQVGIAAPTVVVLENTIGAIAWTRSGVGVYVATLAAAFTDAKTSVSINTSDGSIVRTDVNSLTLSTFDATPVAADAILVDDLVEVRVYV